MRRRRKKNRGLRWTFALVVVGALGYAGLQYWKGNLPIKPPGHETVAPVVTAPVAQPVSLPPPTPATISAAAAHTATFMSEAEARDAAARAAREQTLKVQQKLRQDNRARAQAAERPAENERCINGQRMKRVDNGWVQAGGDC
jgi:cytoskeletal protein RodZ